MKIQRLFDFVAGTRAKSQDVDDEFNQVVQIMNANDDELIAHKGSSDHDGRYYTETEVENKLTDLKGAGRTTQTIKGNADNLTTHKTSSDHDGRYYTESEVDNKLALKTDKTGDHSGTWQGYKPTDIGDAIISQRVTVLENDVGESKVSSLLTQDKDIFTTGTSKDGTDVSSSVVDGALSDIKLKGMTRTNLVSLFDSGKWVLAPNITVNSPTKVTLNATASNETSRVDLTGMPTNTNLTFNVKHQGEISIYGITNSIYLANYTTSQSITINTGSNTQIRLQFRNGASVGTFTFENPLLEVGTEVKSFISGTKSTVSVALDSVGKNLFDIDDFIANSTKSATSLSKLETGIKIKSDSIGTYRTAYRQYKLIAGKTVVIKAEVNRISGASGGLFTVTNSAGQTIHSSLASYPTPTVKATVPQDGIIRVWLYATGATSESGEVDYNNIQLEYNTLATEWEKYKLSQALYTLPNGETLNKLPNGIYDEVDGSGKRTKRTNKKLLASGDIVSMYTGFANVDVALTSVFSDNAEWKANLIDNNTLLEGYTEVAAYSSSTTTNNYWSNSDNKLYIAFPKGTSLAQAQAELTGKTLVYQLANEVTTQLSGVTIPTGFEKGTITIRSQDGSTEFVAPTFEYKVTLNKSAQIDGNTRMIQVNSNQIIDIYATLRANNLI